MFNNEFASKFIQTSGIFEFINGDLHSIFGVSRWFRDEYVNMYLRNTYKYVSRSHKANKPKVITEYKALDYRKQSAICIASISVLEIFQRKKLGSSLITTIHTSHNKELTFVECVHNEYLQKWLVKNSWVLLSKDDNTYYKRNPNYIPPVIDSDENEC